MPNPSMVEIPRSELRELIEEWFYWASYSDTIGHKHGVPEGAYKMARKYFPEDEDFAQGFVCEGGCDLCMYYPQKFEYEEERKESNMDPMIEKFKGIVEEDIYYLCNKGDKQDGFETIWEEEGEAKRWTRVYKVVTKFPDGRLFQWTYEDGLTEYQESIYPGQYGDWDPVEVEQYEEVVTVTKFRKI